MSHFLRFERLPLFALATLLCTAGCHGNQGQVSAAQDPASDPASANMAPASADSGSQAPAQSGDQQGAPQQVGYNAQQSQPPPNSGGTYAQAPDQYQEDSGYGEQPEYVTDQAPPPLPDYDQPQDPGEGYLWTPGYVGLCSLRGRVVDARLLGFLPAPLPLLPRLLGPVCRFLWRHRLRVWLWRLRLPGRLLGRRALQLQPLGQ
jgi:hypothetical protein